MKKRQERVGRLELLLQRRKCFLDFGLRRLLVGQDR